MLLGVIIACEIGFWIAIVAGLVCRYPLRRPRLGLVLLASAPVIDLILLVTATANLLRGATASWHHGLAALYIGFSLAFGHRMVEWADAQFAFRFADGPRPEKLYGAAYAKRGWQNLARTVVACAVAAAILQLQVWVVDDADRTAALMGTLGALPIVMGVDLAITASYSIWPKRPPIPAEL